MKLYNNRIRMAKVRKQHASGVFLGSTSNGRVIFSFAHNSEDAYKKLCDGLELGESFIKITRTSRFDHVSF